MSEDVEKLPLSPGWLETLRREWQGEGRQYWLTRFVILRALGFVYLAAFLVLANQIVPLIGERGLTPLVSYAEAAEHHYGSRWAVFWRLPSLFWFLPSDALLVTLAWVGVVLSAIVLAGYANALMLLALWALYSSFVHVGQVWYGYGWEIQLLETGLLACFLCPWLDARPFPSRPPPTPVIWLFRWLVVRIMWGAGLIKLRGDTCWKDLSCLYHHYQTQPIPNPLSRYLHFAPRWFHQAGVLFNHVVELVAPFFAFGPRRARHVAGALFVAFQLFLIVSGNLSFLNWLTLVPALACFDDSWWARILPRRLVARAELAARTAKESVAGRRATLGVVLVVAVLSIFPVTNLLSRDQAMNRGYNPLDFVNTYG
ncbi:MAG TPA: lipase maturation factor family protein, partial [Polyangiaceae bacterium]|nr:lipase maturation factor family protein [Polyangiaceae bacterium]